MAEQYVSAFSQLAKSSNTLLLPEKTGDVSSMVTQVSHTHSFFPLPQQLFCCLQSSYPGPSPTYSHSQAMGIYGHMTANHTPRGGGTPPSPPTVTSAPPTALDKAPPTDSTSSITEKDLEATLEQLSASIEDTLASSASTSVVEREKEEEPPHFTVASSPTRHSLKGTKNSTD